MSNVLYGQVPDSVSRALEKRMADGNKRSLMYEKGWVDFSSNDYLGLSGNRSLYEQIKRRTTSYNFTTNGGTGSRLLSGNHVFYKETEELLAGVFKAESCLLFNSGYNANQGVISCVPQKGDTILYDQLAHVCIKEGAWLSKAASYSFQHNDLEDLESKIKRAEGTIYIVTETVFSMDGDIAPIAEILQICGRYGAWLIVDEAHSTGVYGLQGAGWLVEQNLQDRVFARIYTFGKGMGVHGACVAGSRYLTDYLINFARPFIYTTSLPPHSLISIYESFLYLGEHPEVQNVLQSKISLFRKHFYKSISKTAIQPVMLSGNELARRVAAIIQQKKMDVRAILAPTVKVGTERLRISLHAHNTDQEIIELARILTTETSKLG